MFEIQRVKNFPVDGVIAGDMPDEFWTNFAETYRAQNRHISFV